MLNGKSGPGNTVELERAQFVGPERWRMETRIHRIGLPLSAEAEVEKGPEKKLMDGTAACELLRDYHQRQLITRFYNGIYIDLHSYPNEREAEKAKLKEALLVLGGERLAFSNNLCMATWTETLRANMGPMVAKMKFDRNYWDVG